MTREIKFRAWNMLSKTLEPVSSIDWIFDEDEERIIPDVCTESTKVAEKPILMQYTGLKDKNGKEIYEGDIVKEGQFVMQVVWNEKMASFGLSRAEWTFMHYFGEASNPENCEIIGNIHENPEL